jgi:hypothetical protein
MIACTHGKFDPMSARTPVQVRLADEELSALDRYRRQKLNPPSRSRALRELAHIALFGSAISAKPDLLISGERELVSREGASK